MKKHTLLSLSIIVLIIILSACGTSDDSNNASEQTLWDKVSEKGEIVVGTSGTLYPASFYPENSDELTGYDVEVMREIGDRLGIDIKFEQIGIDGLFAAIGTRIDIAINDVEITKDRQETFNFSDPYKYSYTTMIVRKDDLSGIHTLEDLEGKKAGGGATTVFSDIARHYGAEVVTYGNATNDVYLRDVENGRTDTVINDYYLQTLALQAFPDLEIVIHPDLKFHQSEQAIVIPKGEDELTEKINSALEELREDGTLTEISKQFFDGKDASVPPEDEVLEIEGLDF
ncbi:cystine transport system substrate-binding protein [Salirhabdus euzebyi]|uniref:Cystine transport system substrate-binding protein n=1 Tax=Salirhabdus euzebyi TaxID=394506 RepID=A0A841Q825_9BACI|nr:transporter substrate-binding domain-containing protein [Salirhabdus euzebyi]MBB6454749.1 cystine transport system substrate-binding protein [Salirhabdus euzebyi]